MAAPAHWEADVLLADGGAVHLRPITPADGPAILQLHDRMSARSKYLRYFTAVAQLSDAQLRISTEIDQRQALGLTAQLADRLIGVATCHRDPDHPNSGEVAFMVEDAQQGRGLGSILLEHLAAAAAERQITRFTAQVLGDNRWMVKVFLDTGYAITREYDSGVVDLAFTTTPTEATRAVWMAREHRAEARSIARLLAPRSIAVLGDTTDPKGVAATVLANIVAAGFTGQVHADPRPIRAERVPAEGSADLAVLVLPAAEVPAALRASSRAGTHGLVVLTGGFSGVDAGGITARELVAQARTAGMRVLGPNCLGLINTDPDVRLNATLVPVAPPEGGIGVFCQSAALGVAILADLAGRGAGVSNFVSAGHRADVSGNDLLQFWVGDVRTRAVVLYLESFGNARKFARLARVLARTKPVIAVRSGRHDVITPGLSAGARPPEAALAALFARSGVIRTETLDAALDVAELLADQPVPRGPRVVILGNSSALGILAFDAAVDAGLAVVDNGLTDLGAFVTAPDLAAAVAASAARADVDAVLVVLTPRLTDTDHGDPLADVARLSVDTPVLAARVRPAGRPDVATTRRCPGFATPERAVRALAQAVGYGRWLARPVGRIPTLTGVDRAAARALVASVGGDTRPMTDAERVALLRCYGVEVAAFRAVDTPETAVRAAQEVGFPVALKTTDRALRHRVDRAGVRLGLLNAPQLRTAAAELIAAGAQQLYVQVMVPPGRSTVDAALTVTADESFGAVVSFAVGGIAIDLLDDRVFAAVPLTDVDADALIAAPRSAPLLTGYRGMPPVDRAGLIDLALRLSALAEDNPEVAALELRPVLVGPDGVSVAGTTGSWDAPGRGPDERRRLR